MVRVLTAVVPTLSLSCPCLALSSLILGSYTRRYQCSTVSIVALKNTFKNKLKSNAGSWKSFFFIIYTDLASLTSLQQADCPTASDLLANMS